MAALGLHCFVRALSSCCVWASLCGGFSCCRAWALDCRLSSCCLWALEHRLNSCGAQIQLFLSTWDLPRPGTELLSSALAGRFLTTGPPGKSLILFVSCAFEEGGSSGSSDGKESACSAGDLGLIPGWGISLEKGMATHSRILAWRIPWTEEPGGLQFMGLQRVRHDCIMTLPDRKSVV